METLWTMILGAIQGATEFLPVSSSGHLAAGQLLLESEREGGGLSEQPLLLEILLHVATLLAVVVVYRRDLWEAILGAGRGVVAIFRGELMAVSATDDDVNLAVALCLGTLPTGVVAVLIKEPAISVATNSTGLGVCFLACACILASTFWWKGGDRRLSWRMALLIGLFQGMAVLPGISRSGTTIAVALALGIGREEAAKFSFLLSIPAILGAAVLELDLDALTSSGWLGTYLLGGLAAFLVGLGALLLLIRVVRGGRMWAFAPYVALLGVASIVFF